MLFAKLNDLSIGGKGSYGIAASAVERTADLPTYLRITDIYDDGTLNLSELKSVDAPNSDKYILKPNDIVFARTGGSTGRNYFYDGSDGVFVYAGFLIKFSIDPEKVNPKYVKYYCRSKKYNDWVKFFNTGSTRGNINAQTFGNMEILLPGRKQQDYLVSILEPIDEKIKINKQVNDNLLAQAQSLFTQRFITDDIEGREKPLYDFADYINGAAFKPGECGDRGLPIIKIVELKNGITDSTKYFDGFKGEKYLIQDKDILFSWSGNPDTSIDIFIWTHGRAILNQHTFNVKSNTGHHWFTFLMLKHFKPEFSRIASNKQTTGLGHVTANDLKRLTFIFNETAIETFEQEVSPFMETIYSNMIENQRLELLRDSLLPRLMSGEIEVSTVQL